MKVRAIDQDRLGLPAEGPHSRPLHIEWPPPAANRLARSPTAFHNGLGVLVDYRTGVLAIRSLVEGEAAFLAALERSPDFDAEAFATFAKDQNLREWLTPLVDSERARSLLSAPFVAALEAERAAQPQRKQALLELCEEIRTAFGAAEVPCLFLKGLYLGERFYGDVHRRHQYDVDVLVRPADFEAALNALAPLGFDVTTAVGGKPVARRLQKIRTRSRERAPQTVTVGARTA